MGINEQVLFWGIFIILNSLYFWPRFLLEDGRSQLFPLRGLLKGDLKQRLRWLLIRINYDPFRISIDFLILAAAYPLFLDDIISPLAYAIALFIFYGFSLAYQVYFTAFEKIYHVEPVLFHDWFMIKVALRIFIFEVSWKNFFIAVGSIAFALMAFFLILAMINAGYDIDVPFAGKIVLLLVIALGLLSMKMYNSIQFPQVVFQSQIQSMVRNFMASRRAVAEVHNLKLTKMKDFNLAEEVELKRKPNIYFIVVESYGRIIADNPEFKGNYSDLLSRLQLELTKQNWYVHSNCSISPITAGASWISYTSMLYGLNVKGQGLFLTLFKNERIAEYDSLFNWLGRQGYKRYRLSSLGGYKKMDIPYERYSQLYGVDRWILHSELGYEGREYGFGPSPPDQYALHFAHEVIRKESNGPFGLFYITQNSHTPFESPAKVAEDWKSLIDRDYVAPARSKIWSRPRFDLYGDAISYQLRFLTDFILKKGTDNDIFILIGDHQPASLSIPITRFETPVHVISKNQEFNKLWTEYGFDPGMMPKDGGAIRQEALLWALYRSMIRGFGRKGDPIPEFLEAGIPF